MTLSFAPIAGRFHLNSVAACGVCVDYRLQYDIWLHSRFMECGSRDICPGLECIPVKLRSAFPDHGEWIPGYVDRDLLAAAADKGILLCGINQHIYCIVAFFTSRGT